MGLSYICREQRVPADHPLRRVRALVDAALQGMSPQFSELYARSARPSIAPEKLLRALLQGLLSDVQFAPLPVRLRFQSIVCCVASPRRGC